MKKHLLISTLSMLLMGFCIGQTTNYDFTFEPGTTQGTWKYFENGSNTEGLTFVANPFPGGVNSSATVAKFTAAANGTEWSGCESIFGTLGKWKFDGSNPTTVTVDVYKTTLSPVHLKFTSTNAAGQGTVFTASKVPSAINEWVTLTYVVDFSTTGGENNADNNAGTNQVVFHVDQAPRTTDHVVYLDNLKFTATKLADPVLPSSDPTVAAPTPTADPAQVLSIFSDAYTNLAGTNFNPNWGQSTVVSEILISGNKTLKYANLNYQGTNLGSADGTDQNLTSKTYMHVDFFTKDATNLQVFLISRTTGEKAYTFTVTKDSWVSVDIPLSTFTTQGLSLNDIYQLKFVGNGTVYLDNLYFGAGVITPTEPTEAAPTPTVNSADVISIFSNAYSDLAGTNFDPNWGQATDATMIKIAGNDTYKLSGLNYQGINIGSTDGTPQDVSAMKYLHLDFWSANSTSLQVFIISPGPVETPFTLTVPTTGWASVNIPLTSFAPVDLTKVFQFKFVGNGTIFIDNIYFYKETATPETDATLSDLKVDGATVSGFSPSTLSYNVKLPTGTTVVPTVTATPNVAGAGVVITPAASLPGTTSVKVTATDGTTTKTYTVAFTVATPQVDLPVTFEDLTLNYELQDFEGNTSSAIVVDPTDPSNHCVKSIKTAAAMPWAGTTVANITGFANKIPFVVGSTKMSVRVWSPTAVGTHIRLKVEKFDDPTISVETEALTTKVNEWEILVFDFTVPTSPPTAALDFTKTYNKASMFFNFGTDGATAGEQIYYWDDIYFGELHTGLRQPNPSNDNMSVYPNPAENDLYFTSKTTLSKVAIYNAVGKQVKEYGNVLKGIDVSNLKTGVYILKAIDVNGKTVTSKFIKK